MSKGIFVAVILLALVVALGFFILDKPSGSIIGSEDNVIDTSFKKFSSAEEFEEYVNDTLEGGGLTKGVRSVELTAESSVMAAGDGAVDSSFGEVASEYSTTNIQVEGVDEADIVKNDGKYIYVVSGRTLYIVNAFPAEDMEIISEINLSGYISNFYLKDDKIVMFGLVEKEIEEKENSKVGIAAEYYPYPRYDRQNTAVKIYDISDKEEPKLEQTFELDGNYRNSRMVGDYLYVVSNKYISVGGISPPIHYANGQRIAVLETDVYYPEYGLSGYQFTSVSAIGIDNEDFETETFLLGASHTLYMSEDNIYLTEYLPIDYEKYNELIYEEFFIPLLPKSELDKAREIIDDEDIPHWEKQWMIGEVTEEWFEKQNKDGGKELMEKMEELMLNVGKKSSKLQRTAIYRVSVDEGNVKYEGSGSVPGGLLNQFSMDEYKGDLRVATTTGGWFGFGETESLNHLYILDSDLKIIGSVEDLAPGERIFSARFMGEKAYMVTFRQVDPLFVIDTSNPRDPEVLGYLKITGFSDYLHPYSENVLIGIGKETEVVGQDRVVTKGVKISLFDVSDFDDPKEVDKVVIGESGSYTAASYDHKAVLFDRKRNLLVLPMQVSKKNTENGWSEVDFVGAYVFDVKSDSIKVRGKISHVDEEKMNEKDEDGNKVYYDYWRDQIKRSLFMDDVLYTVSDYLIKANDLDDLGLINDLVIREKTDYDYPVFYAMGDVGIAETAVAI